MDSTSQVYEKDIEKFLKDETKLPKRLQPTRVFYNIELEKFITRNGLFF